VYDRPIEAPFVIVHSESSKKGIGITATDDGELVSYLAHESPYDHEAATARKLAAVAAANARKAQRGEDATVAKGAGSAAAASNSTSVLSPNNTANFVGAGWQFVAYSYRRLGTKYDLWINNSHVRTQATGMGGTYWNTNGSPSIVFGNRAITSPYDASPASIGHTFFAVNVYIDPEAMTNIYWRSSTNYVATSQPSETAVSPLAIRVANELASKGP
jgi:hypothetical protein